MNILSPLIIPTAVGATMLVHLLRRAPIAQKTLLMIALAPPLGLALCSLFMFWSHVILIGQAKMLALILPIGTSLFFVFILLRDGLLSQNGAGSANFQKPKIWSFAQALRRMRSSSPVHKVTTLASFILFVVYLVYYLQYFLSRSVWDVFGGWDARYFWNLKAKFYFRTPELWTRMFSPKLDWSHLDYPLMLPGSVAWGWNQLNREFLAWPILVGFVFMISLLLLILWFLSTRASWPVAFLGATYLLSISSFRFWSTTQYADIPFCFFVSASVILLLLAAQARNRSLYFLSGFLSGLSAWTKNEGMLFLAISAVMGLVLLAMQQNLRRKERTAFGAFYFLGALIPLAATIYLRIFLAPDAGDLFGKQRHIQEFLTLASDLSRTKFIALSFAFLKLSFAHWNGLWWLFLLALILSGSDAFLQSRWIFVLAVILMESGYFLVFQITPHDLSQHVQTSLDRLMLHSGVLVLIFSFESLGRILRTASPLNDQI